MSIAQAAALVLSHPVASPGGRASLARDSGGGTDFSALVQRDRPAPPPDVDGAADKPARAGVAVGAVPEGEDTIEPVDVAGQAEALAAGAAPVLVPAAVLTGAWSPRPPPSPEPYSAKVAPETAPPIRSATAESMTAVRSVTDTSAPSAPSQAAPEAAVTVGKPLPAATAATLAPPRADTGASAAPQPQFTAPPQRTTPADPAPTTTAAPASVAATALRPAVTPPPQSRVASESPDAKASASDDIPPSVSTTQPLRTAAAPLLVPTAPVVQPWIAAETPDDPPPGPADAPLSVADGTVPARPGPVSSTPASVSAPVVTLNQLAPLIHSFAPRTGFADLTVTLAPQELGSLHLRVAADADGLRVTILAERPETLDLMRRNGDQLLADLRNLGFGGASLGFGTWGGGQAKAHDSPPPAPDAASPATAFQPVPAPSRPDRAGALDLRL